MRFRVGPFLQIRNSNLLYLRVWLKSLKQILRSSGFRSSLLFSVFFLFNVNSQCSSTFSLIGFLIGTTYGKSIWLPEQRYCDRGELFSCNECKRISATSTSNINKTDLLSPVQLQKLILQIRRYFLSWFHERSHQKAQRTSKCLWGHDQRVGEWKYPQDWCLQLSRKYNYPWELLWLFW